MFFYIYFIVVDFLIEITFIIAYFLFIFVEVNFLRASFFMMRFFDYVTIFVFFSFHICYNM